MKSIFVLAFIILITSFTFSQSSSKANPEQYNLKDLQWLSGYWTAAIDGIKMEELWLPESNGLMIGIHRDSFPSGKVFFEYLRISEKESLITYFASPLGNKSTEFKLKILTDKSVIFENPDHDFPQRILYSVIKDTLFVRIEGMVKDELKFKEWRWFRSFSRQ